jgi:hypothetical protein
MDPKKNVAGWPTSNRTTTIGGTGDRNQTEPQTDGCPIFATISSSLKWVIFAAAKIPIL